MDWFDWLLIFTMIFFAGVSVFCYIYTIVSLFRKKEENEKLKEEYDKLIKENISLHLEIEDLTDEKEDKYLDY